MAPADNGLAETVQHQLSQSAGSQNAAPVLHTVPVQSAATASQQWRGDANTIYSARVASVQPGRCGETIGKSIENEPHVKVLTQQLAGRAVLGASVAAEIKVLTDSDSSITAMSKELVQALRGQVGMTQTALTQAFVGHASVVTAIVPTPLNDQYTMGTSPIYHAVYRAPWGGRCGYHRAEDAERETQHRRHSAA